MINNSKYYDLHKKNKNFSFYEEFTKDIINNNNFTENEKKYIINRIAENIGDHINNKKLTIKEGLKIIDIMDELIYNQEVFNFMVLTVTEKILEKDTYAKKFKSAIINRYKILQSVHEQKIDHIAMSFHNSQIKKHPDIRKLIVEVINKIKNEEIEKESIIKTDNESDQRIKNIILTGNVSINDLSTDGTFNEPKNNKSIDKIINDEETQKKDDNKNTDEEHDRKKKRSARTIQEKKAKIIVVDSKSKIKKSSQDKIKQADL